MYHVRTDNSASFCVSWRQSPTGVHGQPRGGHPAGPRSPSMGVRGQLRDRHPVGPRRPPTGVHGQSPGAGMGTEASPCSSPASVEIHRSAQEEGRPRTVRSRLQPAGPWGDPGVPHQASASLSSDHPASRPAGGRASVSSDHPASGHAPLWEPRAQVTWRPNCARAISALGAGDGASGLMDSRREGAGPTAQQKRLVFACGPGRQGPQRWARPPRKQPRGAAL